jgi:hypothetical protein
MDRLGKSSNCLENYNNPLKDWKSILSHLPEAAVESQNICAEEMATVDSAETINRISPVL